VNWEAVGAIGETLGAAGVVVTLAYLAMQLKQNTRALRSNFWQAIQEAESRLDHLFSSDPAIGVLWVRAGNGGLESLSSDAERFQFMTLAKQLIDLFQTHHYQYERGMIEPEMWGTWITQFREDVVSHKGLREVIALRRQHFRSSFRDFVDQNLEQADA